MVIPYFLFTKRDRRLYFPVIIAFTMSYTLMIIAHSLTLADYDRFATPFDWIPLLVVCLITIEFCWFYRFLLLT
jgi:hypothetical protein